MASTIFNINRGKGKKAMSPYSFIPKEQEENKVNLDDPKQLHKILTSKIKIKIKEKKQ